MIIRVDGMNNAYVPTNDLKWLYNEKSHLARKKIT